ncbi:glycoside hydrolase family 3 N-terminal domain-containing protein [Amnibacterium sp. CER49]|uniref:glycoside hydrolase family 3 N-terminal domain-containing protein n=1 Tax=Amnibacterium sp. CER49 TaxID=3039161 RepID=UPI00244C081D|nr:glycoside hydrolase family 3 N-terminal domain-containing protein [Amnibacterium sp. CER49]MDH2442385.1 glycoside hydrolase family 3 N-terminal domain-containing protein [Amnibacterium sp. CER49]
MTATPAPTVPTATVAPPVATPSPSATTIAGRAAAIVGGMTARQQAGTVLMTAGTVDELPGLAGVVRRYALGGVMVRGRSTASVATVGSAVSAAQAAAPAGLPLLVATDQEGGEVQVLQGADFGAIPSAVTQGTWGAGRLTASAATWGSALRRAGVDLDLAPVADTPCPGITNPPVAALDRQYSDDPAAAATSVAAAVRGFAQGGVATTVKHFPGLGCVTANTDTTAQVVDDTITETSPRLRSFEAGIAAGAAAVMISSATYTKIDPGRPAVFSPVVIGDLLRTRLGFSGVVMTDDVGAAVALKAWSPGERAVRFVDAGGDLVLDIVPEDMGPMSDALTAKATADPGFATKLRAAAQSVVAARLRLAQ